MSLVSGTPDYDMEGITIVLKAVLLKYSLFLFDAIVSIGNIQKSYDGKTALI